MTVDDPNATQGTSFWRRLEEATTQYEQLPDWAKGTDPHPGSDETPSERTPDSSNPEG
jgi:hypothetical protein